MKQRKKKTLIEPIAVIKEESNEETGSAENQPEDRNSATPDDSELVAPLVVEEHNLVVTESKTAKESESVELDVDKENGSDTQGADDCLEGGWNSEVTKLGLSGMTLNLMLNSVLDKGSEESTAHLYFETGHFRLLNSTHEKKIREAISVQYGDNTQLVIVDGLTPSQETPMMWRERRRKELLQDARKTIESDPHVTSIIEQFNGKLIESSIQALNVEN